MTASVWLPLAFVVPLVLAPLAIAPATRDLVWRLAPWAAAPALALAVFGAPTALEVPSLLVGAAFALDEVARTFLLFTSIVGLLAGATMRVELRADPRRFRFAGFWLAGLAGNLGVVLAQDVVTFYTFFALLTFAAYGFVIHRQDAEARRAGRVYIVLVVLGEGMLLAALLLVNAAGGSLLAQAPQAVAQSPYRAWILALLLGGFGAKAGLLPLHVSLPLVYAAAPVAGTVLLAGAMLKAGLLGWLRWLPLGAEALPDWGGLLASAGLVAVLYGVVVGVVQTNPRSMLAYSSISQMGFMTAALGLALIAPELWPLALAALAIYAAHHALVKSGLFLGVAALEGGAPRGWVLGGMGLLALALAGAPLTGGAIVKFYLKSLAEAGSSAWNPLVAMLLPLGAFGTAILMARLLWVLRTVAPRAPRIALGRVWSAALVSAFGLIWFVPQLDRPALAHHWSVPASWWQESWPVAATALAALLSVRLWRGPALRRPLIPAGDVVVPAEAVLRALVARGRSIGARLRPLMEGAKRGSRWNAAALQALVRRSQGWLQHWPVAGVLFLALLLALLFLLVA